MTSSIDSTHWEDRARGYWWRATEEEAHQELFNLARELDTEQRQRRRRNWRCSLHYGDRSEEYQPAADASDMQPVWSDWGNLTYNVVRVAVDTLAAKVAKAKPKATFLTDGGSWAQQRRAKRLDSWVHGVFHTSGLYRMAQKVFRDGSVCDVGGVKAYVSGGKIVYERVDPDDVRVGMMDGRDGAPRTMLHSRTLARYTAHQLVEQWHADKSAKERKKMHGLVEAAAANSNPERHLHVKTLATLGDVVQVHEAWHLPSYPGAGDGRHVVALSNLTLVDEEWELDRFPFAFFRFGERRLGFYGQGVAELLLPRQRAINSLLRKLEDCLRLMSVGQLWSRTGSKVNLEQFSNEPYIIIRGVEKPEPLPRPPIPPELFRAYRDAINESLESVGVSMLSASAKKPAGLNAAVALREYSDLESERFALVHQAFEAFFMEAAELALALGEKAAEDGEPVDVSVPHGRRVERVKWADVKWDRDTFVLKMHSSSSLPTSPAARRQAVRELWDDGLIDTVEYRRLLDMPDLDASLSLTAAARDDIDSMVESFLDGDDGEGAEDSYAPPEPFQDLQYGVKRCQSEYLRAKADGCPEERLELLRRWMEQARDMLSQQPANDPQAAGGAPGAPGAPPPPGAPPGAAPPGVAA